MLRSYAIVLLVVIAALVAVPCLGQAPEQPKGISVSGYAEVKAKPDVAYVSLGVSTENRDAGRAAQANAKTTDAVVNAVVKSGIAKNDIETQRYSIEPIYDYQKNPAVVVGYRVSNTVRVTVRDLTKVGNVIDTAVGAGANNVQGVQFDLQDRSKARRAAVTQALQNAAEEAQLIAGTLGIKVGAVVYVSESGGITPPRPMDFAMEKVAAIPSTPIMPGDIEINASVNVVYGILPR